MRTSIHFVPALLALTAALAAACGDGSLVPATPPGFPEISVLTSATVDAQGGRLVSSVSVSDPASGASILIPALTTVLTNDESFDANNDGVADALAVTIGPVSAAAQAVRQASIDEGASLFDLDFAGGFGCFPADTSVDQRIELRIPAAPGHGMVQGQLLDVWRFVPASAASAASYAYWAYAGVCPVALVDGKPCGFFEAYQLGDYALSKPTGANRPPAIALLTANPGSVQPNKLAQLYCQASDPDGDDISFEWSGPGTFDSPASAGSGWRWSEIGPAVLRCTVRDIHGNASNREAVLWVSGSQTNLAPVIVAIQADPETAGIGDTVHLSCAASDPEGDSLTYSWSGPGVFATPLTASTDWTGSTAGLAKLACAVSDGHGHTASSSVTVAVLDLQPPVWSGSGPGLQVTPREGYVLITFGSAADAASAPVTYTLYYGARQGFPANAQTLALGEAPALPCRIDGLSMGTAYTFGIVASDAANPPNATAMAAADATPQPYYDAAPRADLVATQSAQCFDIAAIAQTATQLVVVWSEQGAGLKESHFSDNVWKVSDVLPGKIYTLPKVFFIADRPAILAADFSGTLDLLIQQIDGSWTTHNIFKREGTKHTALDAQYLPVTRQLFIGHATATGWPPTSYSVHFASRDLTGAQPAVIYDKQDLLTATSIGEVRMRLDRDGNPTLFYSWGTRDLTDLGTNDLHLSMATYDLMDGELQEQAIDGYNPLYFDAKANPAGWSLAVVELVPITLGPVPYRQPVVIRLDGTPGSWTSNQMDPGTFTPIIELPGAYDFDIPLECSFSPADTTIYYVKGTGGFFPLDGIGHVDLSMWVAPPIPPEPVPNLSLTRLRSLRSDGGVNYLAGIETPELEMSMTGDPSYMPSGRLLVSEIQ